jgi:hypothetical protein
MMAPSVYEEARANAPLHIQLRRSRMAPPPTDATSVRVTGRVLRIFRNRGGPLHFGQKIRFFIPIINSARSAPPVLDGTIRHAWDRIGPARYLETFLEFWDDEFHLVRSQVAPIRCPTWRPVCGPETKGFCAREAFENGGMNIRRYGRRAGGIPLDPRRRGRERDW